MKVLVTGASGFLGKYVVAAALRQGYDVVAALRPTASLTPLSWHAHPRVEILRWDLCTPDGLPEMLQGVDAIIHLAAAKTGTFEEQFAGTVTATENLLAAMARARVLRLIAIGTFSVYDYLQMKAGDLLDERSPIESDGSNRDAYAQTKLVQEERIRQFEGDRGAKVTFLRPGMVYGRECLWHASLGAKLGEKFWLKIGGDATPPVTYVENCAEAIVASLHSEAAVGQVLNIVDDERPSQDAYIEGLLKRSDSPPRLIPASWPLMQAISGLAWWPSQALLRGKIRLPGILVPAKLHPRFKPLRYSNERAREVLGWQPRYSFEEALERSFSADDLLRVEASE